MGERIAIGADAEPDLSNYMGRGLGGWRMEPTTDGGVVLVRLDRNGDKVFPLPLGVVVGTAVVARCVRTEQVVFYGNTTELHGTPWVYHPADAALDEDEYVEVDASEKYDYGPDQFQPGRWALMLDDAKPVSARCPRCWGYKGDPDVVWSGFISGPPSPCGLCSGSGVVDDPQAAALDVGEWS